MSIEPRRWEGSTTTSRTIIVTFVHLQRDTSSQVMSLSRTTSRGSGSAGGKQPTPVPLSLGTLLCPYGIAYRRVYGWFMCGLCKPSGGLRPVHKKSICLTQSTSGPYGLQIWSRNPQNLEAKEPSKAAVWMAHQVSRQSAPSRLNLKNLVLTVLNVANLLDICTW